ncbi:GerMN domain-containing protein [Paenibacillus glacialis]|nr:GerMN domain-containing protein [Paenibacillus glacialis]
MIIGVGCGQKPLSDGGTQIVGNEASNTNNQEVPTTEKGTSSENNKPATNLSSDSKEVPVNVPVEDAHKEDTTLSQDKDTKQSTKIQVYYTDTDATLLQKSEYEIHFANDTEKYQSAFKALQDDSNPDLISLWSKITLKTLSFNSGKVTLDIHMPDEARLGAGGEQFALDALKNTLFQFEEVKSIELLVDGAAVESLMGHADLEHPMVR